jgi:hypothetical protein
MNAEDYKHRKEHLTFPSGLELDITPPSALDLLDAISDAEGDGMKRIKSIMELLGKGFPEGFTPYDINDPKDVMFMVEYVESFFGRIAPPESQESSESSS